MTTVRPDVSAGPWLIAMAASAEGIPALKTVLENLPTTIPAAVVIVLHHTANPESKLARILERARPMSITTAKPGGRIQKGVVYIAPPDHHLIVKSDRHFAYIGARNRFVLSSANPLFDSAAQVFGDHTIAVILAGDGFDGKDGIHLVNARGGIVIAQDPASAAHPSMPASAVSTGIVDYVLPLEAIAPALNAIVLGRPMEWQSV
jgi:two-component system, chemotaxis family, protein-glutamate methylesterase/glutaminase